MSEYDDWEDHNAAVAEAEYWEREADYEHEIAITQHLEEREADDACRAREEAPDGA